MAETTQEGHETLLDAALDLLRDSRYSGTDPGHARTYGQRRRRLMDAIIEDQQAREQAAAQQAAIDAFYCAWCEHPVGYHTPDRGCTMPLDASGLPVSRTDNTIRTCGCKEETK